MFKTLLDDNLDRALRVYARFIDPDPFSRSLEIEKTVTKDFLVLNVSGLSCCCFLVCVASCCTVVLSLCRTVAYTEESMYRVGVRVSVQGLC